MKTLLCIDGNSILNRAFYGIRLLTAKDGTPTNALYGMINIFSKQIEEYHPDFAAVAFDLKAPTFRHKMYDAYKAGRHAMPDELRAQMPIAKQIVPMLGLHVLELEGYEADDILGTLAAMARDYSEDCRALVLTGDRDSLQLIDATTNILLATNQDTLVMDRDAFFAKYGVEPEQFVDVKALMGDSSDNIPGVPGIGEKTALKLIGEYGSLDGIYEQLPTAKHTPSVRAKLENGKDSAYLSQTLARICCQVPLHMTLDDLAYTGMDRAAAREMFTRLEFTGYIKRFGLDKDDAPVSDAPVVQESVADTPVAPDTCTDLMPVASLADLSGDLIGFDFADGVATLTDGTHLLKYTGDLAAIPAYLANKQVICYDCKTIYRALSAQGCDWHGCHFDAMLAAWVDDPGQGSYAPDRLTVAYLGEIYKPEQPLALYALRMYEPLSQKLRESGQYALLMDIEMPLAGVLASMEDRGCMVDREGIARYGALLDAHVEQLEERIHFSAGGPFNINSPKQLGEVLFERLGLPAGKKTKTGYSTNAEVLEKLKKYHPIIEDILEYRQMTKLRSAYVEGLLSVADEQGRIHTTFKQTGTATGRLSSAEPNLQNIPIRTELGRELRRYFIPESSDYVLLDADYSQIELRLLAIISDDEAMKQAFIDGEDIHTATACRVFGVEPDQVTVELRKRAKAVNFGIVYGMGEFSLAEDLHISRAAAKEYIDGYMASYPGVSAYLSGVIKQAYEDGYVTTEFGRRRAIPELSAQNKNLKHFGERVAMNSPIQGTAADIIKIAMIRVDDALRASGHDARLILQVHDELIVECHKDCRDEVLAILKHEMENAAAFSVPMLVDAKWGKDWYEAH
ncbi:MAG: DNA polymerase I [Clostridia bacterium]|nr:DNA polymerase I [Clostridia bacterium]